MSSSRRRPARPSDKVMSPSTRLKLWVPAITVTVMLRTIYVVSAYGGYKMSKVYSDDDLVGLTSTKPFPLKFIFMMQSHQYENLFRAVIGLLSFCLSFLPSTSFLSHFRVAPALYLIHLCASLFSSFLSYSYLDSVNILEPIVDRCPWHEENHDEVPSEYPSMEYYCELEWWLISSVFSYLLVAQIAMELCVTFLVCAWCRTVRREARLEPEQRITWAASEGAYLKTYTIRICFFAVAVFFSILAHICLIDFGMLPKELKVVRSLVFPIILFVIINLIGLIISFRSRISITQAKTVVGSFWGYLALSSGTVVYQWHYLQYIRLPELRLEENSEGQVPLGWEDRRHYAEFFADKIIHLALPFAFVWIWINAMIVLLVHSWAISVIHQAKTMQEEEGNLVPLIADPLKESQSIKELESVKVDVSQVDSLNGVRS